MYVKCYIWHINIENQELMTASWFIKLHIDIQIEPTTDPQCIVIITSPYQNCVKTNNQEKVHCIVDH